ncbi:RPAP1-like protein [Cercophora scortea]|uniref:RPAP1-like protein n=1 Tax=Cercophora scortea TaxID=314031 RepID=A0AAE0M637_9PEZI|nr:RPAP1-like protein [Cercophora scortea]
MESTLQVFDIKERTVSEVKPPSFPTPSPTAAGGFPKHKKRVSAFKQQRQAQSTPSVPAPAPATAAKPEPSDPRLRSRAEIDAADKKKVDEENTAAIQSMSPEEIAQAQRDLYESLDPTLLQMLLKRANLDEPQPGPSPFDIPQSDPEPATSSTPTNPPKPTVEDTPDQDSPAPPPEKPQKKPKKTVTFDDDAAPPAPPPGAFPITAPPPQAKPIDDALPTNTTHFPHAPSVPDLDPSDPDFLESLHQKFFPNLPADPSKLAWMAPLPTPNSTADRESPYYPGQDSLPVSALRFDFSGALLPPRASRDIPVTKGLHHHGEAPEAAGYTIPELARLARSAVPAQRCIAFRTLGRMLYRLGRGEWGIGAGGRSGDEDDLAFGLWRCFQEGRVLDSLTEWASLEDGVGHRSSKAYATEALWLFEKGGWKEKWRGV